MKHRRKHIHEEKKQKQAEFDALNYPNKKKQKNTPHWAKRRISYYGGVV